MTLEEIQQALDELKRSSAVEVKFAYKKRQLLRWQPLAIVGFSKQDAMKEAERQGMYYDADWLMYSVDGGKTWLPVPPGSEIPRFQ